MTLPTNIPNLSDITSIVVGELSCDGIEGSVLKVIGFLVQLETLEKRLESRASKKFSDEAQDSWNSFVQQFTDSAQAVWEEQLTDFEKWLADAEQGNILGGLGSSFGPQEFMEAGNLNDFAIFDYNSTVGNLLNPGGTHQDLANGTGCDAGVGFSLASSFTSSFSAVLSPKLNVAGQVATFGASLVNKAQLFLQGLAETASQLSTIFDGNEAIFNGMLTNADAIVAALGRLSDEDYEAEVSFDAFNNLLTAAIRDLKDLERRMASGDVNTTKARASLKTATAWVCESSGSSPKSVVLSTVTALTALLQAQVDLFQTSFLRTVQLSVNIAAHRDNLREETKFQPTYSNFFAKARCGLEKIQAELSAVGQQNTVLFQVKKLEWCAVMKSYQALIERYHPERFRVDLEAQFETDLGQDVQELGVELSTADLLETSADAVVDAAKLFLNRSSLKLKRNISLDLVKTERDKLAAAIKAYKQEAQQAKEALEAFLNKAGVQDARDEANLFFQAAQTVVALVPIVTAMIDGEYNTMFTLDGLNSQLSDIVAQVISKAVECCEENGATDNQSRAGLRELSRAQSQANSDARAAAFDAHFGAPAVGSNSSTRILFDMKTLKQQYQRFKRLMQIPCLGNIGSDLSKII